MIHRVLDPSGVVVVRESTELIRFLSVDSCREDALPVNNRKGSPSARMDEWLV